VNKLISVGKEFVLAIGKYLTLYVIVLAIFLTTVSTQYDPAVQLVLNSIFFSVIYILVFCVFSKNEVSLVLEEILMVLKK
jgi:hypothetical protein